MNVVIPDRLDEFEGKLKAILTGRHPPLTRTERMWTAVFNRVAARFPWMTKEESYWMSFWALYKCQQKGNEGYYKYLRRACLNAHLDYTRRHKPHDRLRGETSYEVSWADIDARIDLTDAVVKLDEPHARVIRMSLAGKSRQEMVAALGMADEQVRRRLREAEARLRQLLGDDYAER